MGISDINLGQSVNNPANDEFQASSYNAIGNGTDENFFSAAGDWLTKGVPLAVASGINQMWNSIGWAGNKIANIGNDNPEQFEGTDLGEWIVNNFDDADSYSTYYNDHKEGIDLGGFLLGSAIPSTLALKGLAAAQKGLAVSRAGSLTTGLMTNTAERFFLNKARMQLAEGASTLGSRFATAGSKAWQVGLETIAAETATFATMSQSPIYDDVKDVTTFATNTLLGGAAFGALGGAWRLGGSFKRIKFNTGEFATVDGVTGEIVTNLKEVEKQVGSVLSEAAYVKQTSNMAGLGLDLTPTQGLRKGFTPENKAFRDRLLAEEKLTVTEKGKTKLNEDALLFTTGDDVTSTLLARMEAKTELQDIEALAGAKGKFAEALSNRRRAVLRGVDNANDRILGKLLVSMDKDGAGLGAPMKALVDDWARAGKSESIAQVFTGAKSLARATAETNNSLAHAIIDLADGSLNEKAVFTLGDLGKVAARNADTVLVSGVPLDLAGVTRTKEAFLKAEPHIAQAKFYAEHQALQKAKPASPLDLVSAELGESVLPKDVAVNYWDLPKAEAQYRKFRELTVIGEDGVKVTTSGQAALETIYNLKQKMRAELEASNPDLTFPELKTRLNVNDSFFTGKPTTSEANIINGIDTEALRHVAVEYEVAKKMPDYFEIRSASYARAKHDVYQQQQNYIADKILGDNKYATMDLSNFDGVDSLAGTVTAANAEWNTVQAAAMHNGTQTQATLLKWNDAVKRELLPHAQTLAKFGDGSFAVTKLAEIKSLVTAKPGTIYFEKSTGQILEKIEGAGYQVRTEFSPSQGASMEQSKAVDDFLRSYIMMDEKRLAKKNLGLQGVGKKLITRDVDGDKVQLYFSPPHPSELEHKVLVQSTDGNIGMLWGKDAKELQNKVSLVQNSNPELTILHPKTIDNYYQLLGEYEDALSLRGLTQVDSTLKRAGVMSDLAPTTVVRDFMEGITSDFARSNRTSMNNALYLKFGQQLAEARLMGDAIGNDSTGVKKIFDTVFNVQNSDTTWAKFNALVERAADWTGGKAMATLRDNWRDIREGKKSLTDFQALAVSKEAGTNIFTSEELWKLSKASSYSGSTQNFLRKTNQLMRTLVLDVDYFNGLVNVIGTPILAVPEIRAMFQAGEDIPYMRLLGDSMKNQLPGPARRKQLEYYAKLGILDENMLVHHDLVDSYSIMHGASTEGVAKAGAKKVWDIADKFVTNLKKPTAFAEQSTQLFAAQLADNIAKIRGITGQERDIFITTFHKKVIGNYTSAQRPMVFQGIVGQAVGLFQTYSFNLFQQAARHIGNGNNKSVAMLAALQGTIFGAQSLPGFELANKGIAAWGGEEHKDAFSETRRVLGKDTAELLLYGGASNLLGANLWTRGDANPRNITGIPVTPADLAQVSYYGKAISSVMQFGNSIIAGGNLKVSAMEAIAHANISRPLTGIAELSIGARTSQGGTLDQAVGQDLLSWASAVRLLGAKPMQEALASEATYKFGIIKAKEKVAMDNLAYAMRTEMIAGKGEVDQEVISAFAKKYVEMGGNPVGFRKWYMANLAKATTPRAQLFAEATKNNPWAKTFQEVASPELADGLEPALGTPGASQQQPQQ